MRALEALPLPDASQRSAPPVHIGVYDGPLDLLLFLVKREGVDVRAIPVARICDAYLSVLDELLATDEGIDVDTAGDYLVMAATLCQLKARELLPRAPTAAPEEEEEEDPKERLARRLLEYERYRLAAEGLGQMERLDRDVFARPVEPPAPDEVVVDPGCDALGLLRLFYEVEARRAAPPPVHQVKKEPMTLRVAVRWVMDRLADGREWILSQLFLEDALLGPEARPRRIFTFLSVLEMARLQLLDVNQQMHLGAIRIQKKAGADDVDLSALEDE